MQPRRGRSRIAMQIDGESRAPGSDEDVEQQGIPLHRRGRQAEEAKRCRFERWSYMALLEVMRRRIVFSEVAPDRGICLSISTSLETGVAVFEEREVAVVLECLRDCGPVVILFFNSLGFELVLASAELPWSC
ncbi:hypothetical protein F511_39195 [Dorcoceras hygrometricum]|uniref:Uncharacterized protein n=1 Tax=Dorcoceras hygrometricum TaxID=472368 RepID=A0A2Z7D5S1_9LAMI|nr:hypothetical protein F511_39195 [Dorcoceras hygrometricum]